MRSSQWYLIGILLMVMSFWFIRLDLTYNTFCMDSYDQETISAIDVQVCTKSEVYAPFIWLLFPLGWVFIICGWLEQRTEKRKQELVAERWIYEGGQVPEHMRFKGMPSYAPKKHPTSKDIEEVKKFKDKVKK